MIRCKALPNNTYDYTTLRLCDYATRKQEKRQGWVGLHGIPTYPITVLYISTRKKVGNPLEDPPCSSVAVTAAQQQLPSHPLSSLSLSHIIHASLRYGITAVVGAKAPMV